MVITDIECNNLTNFEVILLIIFGEKKFVNKIDLFCQTISGVKLFHLFEIL